MTLLHLQLFWGESQQTFLGLNALPELSQRQENELKNWCQKRRKILKHEISGQPWIKTSQDGNPTELTLKPNGVAVEKCMFTSKAAQGNWNIHDGFLFILLKNDEQTVEYRVIGNADNNIHSAAEYIDGKPHGLVKLVQAKPN